MEKSKEKQDEKKIGMLQLPPLGMPIESPGRIVADLMGSYTGRPIWNDILPADDALPVQDADDL